MMLPEIRRYLLYFLLLWLSVTAVVLRWNFRFEPPFSELLSYVALLSSLTAIVGYFSTRTLDRLDLLSRSRRLASEEGIEEIGAISASEIVEHLYQVGRGREIYLGFDVAHLRQASLRLFEELLSLEGRPLIRVLATGVRDEDETKSQAGAELRYFFDLLQRLAQDRDKVLIRTTAQIFPMNMLITQSSVVVFAPLGRGRTVLRVIASPSGEAGHYYRQLYQTAWDRGVDLPNDFVAPPA
jgi:hypothetical protein